MFISFTDLQFKLSPLTSLTIGSGLLLKQLLYLPTQFNQGQKPGGLKFE